MPEKLCIVDNVESSSMPRFRALYSKKGIADWTPRSPDLSASHVLRMGLVDLRVLSPHFHGETEEITIGLR
jgi:hypothetical protein